MTQPQITVGILSREEEGFSFSPGFFFPPGFLIGIYSISENYSYHRLVLFFL